MLVTFACFSHLHSSAQSTNSVHVHSVNQIRILPSAYSVYFGCRGERVFLKSATIIYQVIIWPYHRERLHDDIKKYLSLLEIISSLELACNAKSVIKLWSAYNISSNPIPLVIPKGPIRSLETLISIADILASKGGFKYFKLHQTPINAPIHIECCDEDLYQSCINWVFR